MRLCKSQAQAQAVDAARNAGVVANKKRRGENTVASQPVRGMTTISATR